MLDVTVTTFPAHCIAFPCTPRFIMTTEDLAVLSVFESIPISPSPRTLTMRRTPSADVTASIVTTVTKTAANCGLTHIEALEGNPSLIRYTLEVSPVHHLHHKYRAINESNLSQITSHHPSPLLTANDNLKCFLYSFQIRVFSR